MKKLFKMAFLSLAMVLLITGCGMKANYSIKIGNDKSVEYEFLIAQDDEMIDAMLDMGSSMSSEDEDSDEEKAYTDKDRWEYVDSSNDSSFKDFKKVKYDKEGYKGYTYTLKVDNIDEISSEDATKVDFNSVDGDAKIFVKNGDTYKLSVKNSDDSNSQMSQYADTVNFDVKLKVTLPNKAISNNATSVEGTTYIWDLAKSDSIELEFKLDGKSSDKADASNTSDDSKSNKNNMILYIGIGAAAVVLIAAVIIVFATKKK